MTPKPISEIVSRFDSLQIHCTGHPFTELGEFAARYWPVISAEIKRLQEVERNCTCRNIKEATVISTSSGYTEVVTTIRKPSQ